MLICAEVQELINIRTHESSIIKILNNPESHAFLLLPTKAWMSHLFQMGQIREFFLDQTSNVSRISVWMSYKAARSTKTGSDYYTYIKPLSSTGQYILVYSLILKSVNAISLGPFLK